MLRPYQQKAVDAVFDYLEQKPDNHPLVVAPTGSGKSHILAAICERIIALGSKVLILSHVKLILEQDEEKLIQLIPKGKVGLYSAGAKRRERRTVTVAGIQSVYEKAYLFADFNYIIIDEAHLIPKEGRGRYLTFLKEMPGVTVIGLTATPFRLGTGLLTEGEGKLFDDVVCDTDIVKLIKDGYLCSLQTVQADSQLDVSQIRTQAGDFKNKDMDAAFDKFEVTREIVAELYSYKDKYKSWLVFAISIEHAIHITEMLVATGIEAQAVHSKRTSTENDAALVAYKTGAIQALVSVAKMTTGFDDPKTDLIALVRPTKSPVLHVQMIGRGLRVYPGKDHCMILDFAGNLMRLGPINDVHVVVKGKGGGIAPIKVCPECKTHVPASVTQCYICGHLFPRLESQDLTKRASAEAAIVDNKLQMPTQDWHLVSNVSFRVHKGKKGDSLCIFYRCGLRTFRKWIAVGRKGSAGMHARYFWGKNSRFTEHPDYKPPATPEVALSRAIKGELNVPSAIFVTESGNYPSITSYRYPSP